MHIAPASRQPFRSQRQPAPPQCNFFLAGVRESARSSLRSLWYPAVNKQIYPWQFSCFISTYGGPMKWLHPIERIVEMLFVAWRFDLFFKPVSRYRQPMHRKQEFI
jgi:hypothetical protein